MNIVEEELATVEAAQAYQFGDVLLVQLAGKKPTPCHIVDIQQAMTDVEPPAFVARMRIDPRAKCARVVTDFEAVQAFRIGGVREEVLVHHSGEVLTVEVRQLGEDAGRALRGQVPGLDSSGPPLEADGFSRDYDLAEAIKDALQHLGTPESASIPDWLSIYSVSDMRVEIGGIAGFNHLRVTLRGS